MRNIILNRRHHLALRAGLLALLSLFLLSSCRLFDEDNTTHTISISLPQWPPDSENDYPPLSRWKITLAQNTGTESFFLAASPDASLEVSVQKNCPFSVQAAPVTLLQKGQECLYFHPAGCLYPSSYDSDSLSASWEGGYTAFILQRLYENCAKNGASPAQAASFVSSFNWEKACSLVSTKVQESYGGKFYNPWLCDTGRLLQNLSDESFRASLLQPSSCYSYSTGEIYSRSGLSVLSPFIPENKNILAVHKITLKKDTPLLLSDAKEFGLFITYKSAKNVLIGYIYIPIYKGDL